MRFILDKIYNTPWTRTGQASLDSSLRSGLYTVGCSIKLFGEIVPAMENSRILKNAPK